MFTNSPYCEDIVPKNHVFLLFDKWENERHGDNKAVMFCVMYI